MTLKNLQNNARWAGLSIWLISIPILLNSQTQIEVFDSFDIGRIYAGNVIKLDPSENFFYLAGALDSNACSANAGAFAFPDNTGSGQEVCGFIGKYQLNTGDKITEVNSGIKGNIKTLQYLSNISGVTGDQLAYYPSYDVNSNFYRIGAENLSGITNITPNNYNSVNKRYTTSFVDFSGDLVHYFGWGGLVESSVMNSVSTNADQITELHEGGIYTSLGIPNSNYGILGTDNGSIIKLDLGASPIVSSSGFNYFTCNNCWSYADGSTTGRLSNIHQALSGSVDTGAISNTAWASKLVLDPSETITVLLLDANNADVVYAGSNSGKLYSINVSGGPTLIGGPFQLNDGDMGGALSHITSGVVDPGGNYIYLGSDGGYVFKVDVSDAANIVQEGSSILLGEGGRVAGAAIASNGSKGYFTQWPANPGTSTSYVWVVRFVFTKPGKPDSLSAVPGDTEVTLEWEPPADDGGKPINGYTIQATPAATISCSDTDPTLNTCTISGLTNGTAYTFEVIASNEIGNSVAATVTTTPSGPLTPPTDLQVTAADGGLSIAFTPGSDEGFPITDYEYQLDSGLWLGAGTAMSPVVIDGLVNGTSYGVHLRAINSNGIYSTSSAEVIGTPLGLPSAPTYTGITSPRGFIEIAFNQDSDGGLPILGYEYQYKLTYSSTAVFTSWIADTATTSPILIPSDSFVVRQTYTFNIRAVNALGAGDSTVITPFFFTSVPGPPVINDIILGDSEVTINWSQPLDDGGTGLSNTAYEIQINPMEGTLGPGCLEKPDVTADTDKTCDISGLTNGTEYTFTIAAINVNGTGDADTIMGIPFGTPPDKVGMMSATGGDSLLNVSFVMPPPPPATSHYEYYYYETQVGGPDSIIWIRDTASSASLVNLIIDSLDNGTEYGVVIRAISSDITAPEGPVDTVFGIPTRPPDAPTEINVIIKEGGILETTFSPPSLLGISPITNYEYTTDGGLTWKDIADTTQPIAISQWSDSSILPTYFQSLDTIGLQIRAINSAGPGPWSVSVPTVIYREPSVPQNLMVLAGNGTAELSWEPPIDSGGLPITQYRVWTYPDSLTCQTSTELSCSFMRLTNGTNYTFYVVAENANFTGFIDSINGLPGLPNSPRNLHSTPEDMAANIYFSPPIDNGIPLIGYQYSIDGGGNWYPLTTGIDTVTTITGLTNKTLYEVILRAENEFGYGPASDPVSVVPGTIIPIIEMSTDSLLNAMEFALSNWAAYQLDKTSDNHYIQVKVSQGDSTQIFEALSGINDPGEVFVFPDQLNWTPTPNIMGGETYEVSIAIATETNGIKDYYSPFSEVKTVVPNIPIAPPQPEIVSVLPGDGTLTVHFSVPPGEGWNSLEYKTTGGNYQNIDITPAITNQTTQYEGFFTFDKETLTGQPLVNGIPIGVQIRTFSNYTELTSESQEVSAVPGKATQMAFLAHPQNTPVSSLINVVTVELQNASGDRVTFGTPEVRLSLESNPGEGNLNGALITTAKDGIATFSGLSIDQAGTGYSLYAISEDSLIAISQPFNITPKKLIVSVKDTSKIYGEPDPEFEVTYSGFIVGQNEYDLNGALMVDRTLGDAVGQYVLTANGYQSNNYSIEYQPGTLTILPKNIDSMEIQIIDFPELTYTGAAHRPDFKIQLNGLELTEGIDYQVLYNNHINAGLDSLHIEGIGNYDGRYTYYFNILPQTIHVLPDSNQTKIYGAEDGLISYQLDGLVEGQTPTIRGQLNRDSGENVGDYSIGLGSLQLENGLGFDTSNYAVRFIEGVPFNITPAVLRVEVKNSEKFVSQLDPEGYGGISITGFQFDDSISIVDTSGLSIFRINDSIHTSGYYEGVISASGLRANNYEFEYIPGDFFIKEIEEILFRLDSISAVYGDSIVFPKPFVSYFSMEQDSAQNISQDVQILGNRVVFQNDSLGAFEFDLLFDSTNYLPNSILPVGTHPIVMGEVSGIHSAIGIRLVGRLNVMPRTIALTGPVDTLIISKIYDGTTDTPNLSLDLSGVFPGDSVQVNGIGRFETSDAGNSYYSVYQLKLSGPDADNYALEQDSIIGYSEGVIVPKLLHIQPLSNQQKTEGEADAPFEFDFIGLVEGEVPRVEGALSRRAGEAPGSYEIELGSLQLLENESFKPSNYQIEFISGAVFTIVDRIDPEDGGETDSLDTDGDGIGDNADEDDDGDGILDEADVFPKDVSEYEDTDGDGIGDNADEDDDGDGVLDEADAFPKDAAENEDTDGDGIGDNADEDDDGDGVLDEADAFPKDVSEYEDTDGDGIGDIADEDDDGDGVLDEADAFPKDISEYEDTDGDGIGDIADEDDDGDGVLDEADAFPKDAAEDRDTDGDGIGDNADTDDDGDGVLDEADAFPKDVSEYEDTDGDGIGDNADEDDDGDGVLDEADAFPKDVSEYEDTDGDGIGDNADEDDDGDGVLDEADAFPKDVSEHEDTDGDGIGDNADEDDDGDGVLDEMDTFPKDAAEYEDTDGDGIGDNADEDDDGDGVLDEADAFPKDVSEYEDTDGDGIGDNADEDDDGDGVLDEADAFPKDVSEYEDTDGDGIGDIADEDDDGDGVLDEADAFPKDAAEYEDTDGDGLGNNEDPDDDNDGLLDEEEAYFGSNPLMLDTDADGVTDADEVADYTNPADGCSLIPESQTIEEATAIWLMQDCDGDGLINLAEMNMGDTDGDGRPNFNDTDDDGDGLLTKDELADINQDGFPDDALDANNNGVPDYLNYNSFSEEMTEPGALEVYHGMSPNGDGMNDVLTIRNIALYPNNEIRIFNRWGNEVYFTEGYGQNDNFFGGQTDYRDKIPSGTYYYILKVWDDRDLKIYRGFFQVNY